MKQDKSKINPRKRPLQSRAKETMEVILKATTIIMDNIGLENLSTNKIAEAAGVSIGSLYQYFPNKESIISSLIERYTEEQIRMIEKEMLMRADEGLESTVRAIVRSQLASKKRNARLNKLAAQTFFKIDGLKHMQKVDERIVQLLKQYVIPFKGKIRESNIEWTFFILIQIIKLLPVSVLFHPIFKIDDPTFEEEMVILVLNYLKC